MANPSTMTGVISSNSLKQQVGSSPDGLNNAATLTQYANNAAAKAAGLVAGDLYLSSADPHAIAQVV